MPKINFTAGRLTAFACPPEKSQAFLWDAKAPGLGLRVTAANSRAFVFQSRLKTGQTLRLTIGEPLGTSGRGVYTIPKAQEEARRLQSLIDQGKDPREEIAAQVAIHQARRDSAINERRKRDVTGLDAWQTYCDERTPFWSERHNADHHSFVAPGGVQRKRASGVTVAGPLRSLLDRPLADISTEVVDAWVAQNLARPTRARLGFRLLRGFINWCSEHKDYSLLVSKSSVSSKRVREKLGKASARRDVLQKEQLAGWFAAVLADPNQIASAYLQCLLLVGPRREELADVRWEDIDFRWHSIKLRDKVESFRMVPLTPYVKSLLERLPRHPSNPFVFGSVASRSGQIKDARSNHVRALKRANIPHLTLHGLRRSFGTLSEWVEAPVGVVAQIQGHKPSAIAEKHYRARTLDFLRKWHTQIESWILAEAHLFPKSQA